MKRLISNLSLLALGAMLACLAVIYLPANNLEKAAPPKVTIDTRPLDREGAGLTSYAPVVRKASSSVVYIYTTRTVREFSRGWDDPIYRFFFGPGTPRLTPPREREDRGLGSGVIVSEDGYILTNNHVVEGADEVQVVLADNRTKLDARIVGTDPATDIAVIKVDAGPLTPATLGDSDSLAVGDLVFAIGNPFGIGQTVTMGIISALSRDLKGQLLGQYESFIQTDASINPGNSGGALIDAEVRVVGINSAIISRSGGNQGVGLAVPINMARTVMDRLVEFGRVVRGFLGVTIQPLTPELAAAFDLKSQQGVLIGGVEPDSPAARAGLHAGDVVVEMDGRPVEDNRQLSLWVAQQRPDQTVTLRVIRDGKPQSVKVTLGERPTDLQAGTGGPAHPSARGAGLFEGIRLADLDSQLRRQWSIPEDVRGALVIGVAPGSLALSAGLQVGDVIREINRQPVDRAEDAYRLARSPENGRLLVQLWSRGGYRFMVLTGTAPRN